MSRTGPRVWRVMENGVAIRAAAAVLGSAIAVGAVVLALAMAGVVPSASRDAAPPIVEQVANRSIKADVRTHSNRESKEDRLRLAAPVVPAVRFVARALTRRDQLHDSFAMIALPRTPPERYAALPPVLPDAEPLPALKSPLDDIRNPLLNDAQIESIRKRLKLTPAQDKLWPPVRRALYEVIIAHAARQKSARHGANLALDPGSAEVQNLKVAALPLLAELRADQKRELNMLARIVGLEAALARL